MRIKQRAVPPMPKVKPVRSVQPPPPLNKRMLFLDDAIAVAWGIIESDYLTGDADTLTEYKYLANELEQKSFHPSGQFGIGYQEAQEDIVKLIRMMEGKGQDED